MGNKHVKGVLKVRLRGCSDREGRVKGNKVGGDR